ncbi:apolipoprotein N-acyltransferase [Abditibacterium utsteinense]|uniref:apolipoprotein N-acyltransferase n=1 Tax=Abditibacterium utsteinense TaxID=1960156 RepID=UPI00130057A3|nr:apolipoprotein N-acyltransferase [Abditibacterium utsteinense]
MKSALLVSPSVTKNHLSRRKLVFLTAFLWWISGAFGLFPLGWIALAPLFVLLDELPTKSRFRVGYGAGFWCFWLVNWWLVKTISGGAPAIGAPIFLGFFLSVIAVTFIAAVHAFQVGIAALFWRGPLLLRAFSVAAIWTLGDYVRTLTPLAHEWGALAFSQTTDLPFLQIAGVLGQHGLTFFCALSAACAAIWWQTRHKKWIVAPAILFLALHVWGFYQLRQPVVGRELRVLVVQTAVSSLSKTANATGEAPFPQALRLTMHALQEKGGKFDLVVWPETTANLRRVGTFYNGLDWETLRQEKLQVPLLIGAQTYDEKNRSWNEAILLSPGGKTQVRAKTRLVPFGERAPLVEYLPFLQVFAINPMLEKGDGPKTFDLNGVGLDTQICFETCFPQRVGSRFLATITNDEWFTGTEAPRQHRAMAAMRAVENHAALVQSANGGYSFAVTPRGEITVSTRFGLPDTLDVTLVVPR